MNTISVNYTIKWNIKNYENYIFTSNNLCFNLKTGKQIKQIYNNGCIGYNFNRKFISLNKLRPLLYKPKKEILPF